MGDTGTNPSSIPFSYEMVIFHADEGNIVHFSTDPYRLNETTTDVARALEGTSRAISDQYDRFLVSEEQTAASADMYPIQVARLHELVAMIVTGGEGELRLVRGSDTGLIPIEPGTVVVLPSSYLPGQDTWFSIVESAERPVTFRLVMSNLSTQIAKARAAYGASEPSYRARLGLALRQKAIAQVFETSLVHTLGMEI